MGVFQTLQAGAFQMGSPPTELGREYYETLHEVILTGDFAMLSTEVTQEQFQSLMGYNPSSFAACGVQCPVENVTWHEAAAYCNALSSLEGLDACYACSGEGAGVTCDRAAAYPRPYDCPGYRLPTEAEWEYAARAGTSTATYHGDLDDEHLLCEQPNAVLDGIAWFCGNSGDTTHAVGALAANAWGLFDMLGNTWEWCNDWAYPYSSSSATDPWGASMGATRIARGSSWFYGARFARAARRTEINPIFHDGGLGFRVARSLP